MVDILFIDAAVGNDRVMTVIHRITRFQHLDMRYGRNAFYGISICAVQLVEGATEIAAFCDSCFAAQKKAVHNFYYRQRYQGGKEKAEQGAPELFFAGKPAQNK